METIDVRGLACPAPVLELKQCIDQGAKALKVICDCGASTENIQRYATNAGFSVEQKPLNAYETEFTLRKQ